MTKKRKDKLVESAASRSKRKPKNDYSWVESDMSEDEVSEITYPPVTETETFKYCIY